MKVAEVLKLGEEMLKLLQDSCIKVNYVQYLGMYEEYVERVKTEKKSYVVTCLSEKYHVSERQVYYIVDKLGRDCNFGAVEK